MASRWNPEAALLDRPVPQGVRIDPQGLVESWIAEAQDWMTAYAGTAQLTEREAFEGIECFGRLTRTRSQLLSNAEGKVIVEQLSALLDRDSAIFFNKAAQFPAPKEWLSQANEAWEDASEDAALIETLVRDLDALDFLFWFGERHGVASDRSESLDALTADWQQMHLWIVRRTVFFVAGEAYIRAVAKTISEELEVLDSTGWLALSTAKYITMLDRIEQAWDEMTGVPTVGTLLKQRPLGGHVLDYQGIPVLASAEGAGSAFAAPRAPIRWYDAARQFEATTYLPQATDPTGQTPMEITFQSGKDFSQPATDLVAMPVQLGGASGTIQKRQQDDFDVVFATVIFEDISHVETKEVTLRVSDREWQQ